jgi:hypothetical protein
MILLAFHKRREFAPVGIGAAAQPDSEFKYFSARSTEFMTWPSHEVIL